MQKILKSYFFISIALVPLLICSCDKEEPVKEVTPTWIDAENGTLYDPMNEQEYDVVRIGDQVWMAENLKSTRYANGDAIPDGIRIIDGKYQDLGKFGVWWSSTMFNKIDSWYLLLSSTSSNTYWWGGRKNYGISVRCLED